MSNGKHIAHLKRQGKLATSPNGQRELMRKKPFVKALMLANGGRVKSIKPDEDNDIYDEALDRQNALSRQLHRMQKDGRQNTPEYQEVHQDWKHYTDLVNESDEMDSPAVYQDKALYEQSGRNFDDYIQKALSARRSAGTTKVRPTSGDPQARSAAMERDGRQFGEAAEAAAPRTAAAGRSAAAGPARASAPLRQYTAEDGVTVLTNRRTNPRPPRRFAEGGTVERSKLAHALLKR